MANGTLTGLTSEKITTPGRMWMHTWYDLAFWIGSVVQLKNLNLREKKLLNQKPPPFCI
jgi:hypothetical protein